MASQLLLRGYNPAVPTCDVGADLVLDGVRIQVKASRMSRRSMKVYPNGAYFFRICKMIKGRNRTFSFVRRNLIEECDLVVFWGVDENRFWIVPSNVIDGVQSIILGPSIQHKDVDLEELASLRAAGNTRAQVAEAFGVSAETISRRVRTGQRESKYPRCRVVRSFENRWDLFAEKLAALAEPLSSTDNVTPFVKEA